MLQVVCMAYAGAPGDHGSGAIRHSQLCVRSQAPLPPTEVRILGTPFSGTWKFPEQMAESNLTQGFSMKSRPLIPQWHLSMQVVIALQCMRALVQYYYEQQYQCQGLSSSNAAGCGRWCCSGCQSARTLRPGQLQQLVTRPSKRCCAARASCGCRTTT